MPDTLNDLRAPGSKEGATAVAPSSFHSCQRLDYTVRVQTAIGYTVTHMSWSETLKQKMLHSESFLLLREAREFHDSKGADAGMIIAIREDGSVIGEIPTPRQTAEILARAHERSLTDAAMRFIEGPRLLPRPLAARQDPRADGEHLRLWTGNGGL